MLPQRPDKTLADYLAIAISPALIMALVGSLVFFLLEIGYRGEYAGTLRWTLFWFVLASVLISRISIEHGSTHAGIYGLMLGAAVALKILQFATSPFLPLCLLAVVWWCASKLTWDCTLIDEAADASGQGLLQAAGIDSVGKGESEQLGAGDNEPGGSSLERAVQLEKARRLGGRSGGEYEKHLPLPPPVMSPLKPGSPAATQPREAPPAMARPESRRQRWLKKQRARREGKTHSPGLWVVYFSLAALPLFGVGQVLLPTIDLVRRELGFYFLWIYVASALGLLLTTSFLGLRRYLRQRYLKMPAAMARTWMALGSGLALAVLLFCILVPRPEAAYSLTALFDKLGSPPQPASDYAVVGDEAGEGVGRRLGKARNQNPSASKNGQPGEAEQRAQGENGAQRQNTAPQAGEQSTHQQAGGQSGQPGGGPTLTPTKIEPPSLGAQLAPLLKWIVYGLLGLAFLVFLIRHRARVLVALKQMLGELTQFWNHLFGRKKHTSAPGLSMGETPNSFRPRPFAAFMNPFTTGAARRTSPAELVRYTFDALQAWASEHGLERHPDQTPLEFARRLGDQVPDLAEDAWQATQLYARVAYAGQSPPPQSLENLARLWQQMTALRAVPATGP